MIYPTDEQLFINAHQKELLLAKSSQYIQPTPCHCVSSARIPLCLAGHFGLGNCMPSTGRGPSLHPIILPNVFHLVSTSETSSSAKDRFVWENCVSNLVLMRNRAARFANSADPSMVFRFVSRRTSPMDSLSSSNSGQQSKMWCTDCASSPQEQFREFSMPVECR